MEDIAVLAVPLIISILLTPFIKKLAIRINAIDRPNSRKVHSGEMPLLGGVAIVVATTTSIFLFNNQLEPIVYWILVGSVIIVISGILDDLYNLTAKAKLVAQTFASLVVIFGGIRIEYVNLPFLQEPIYFNGWSWLVTLIWLVGITNALNLIDGLDGLAAGVSSISLGTIFIMSIIVGNDTVAVLTLILLGATLGFLVYNFYPAKIFMGDSGSLYLGFFLGCLSVLGFKNVTVSSFLVPVLLLGVPIFDTLFAIVRRFRKGQSIVAPDKKHLHHCLISMGFSHRKSVLIIYGITMIFSLASLYLSSATMWISNVVVVGLIVFIMLGAELTGITGSSGKLTRLFRLIVRKAVVSTTSFREHK